MDSQNPIPPRPPLQPAQALKLHALNESFCANLPQGWRSGRYDAVPGDRFEKLRVAGVPDGRYRVRGSDWVLGVERQRLVHAVRADPPDFGGADVIEVA